MPIMDKKIPVAPKYIQDFEQLALGMFVHFGLYSQLNSGEWVYSIHALQMDSYRNLKETFDVLDDIYNINDMGNGIMKKLFL